MQNKIAQLEKELILVSGEKRVDLLNELAFLYRGIDILKSKESAFEALELSQKIEYEVGIAESYFQLTEIFTNTDFEKAYVYIEKALELFDASNYEKGVAKALKAQAGLYFQQGDYPTSLKINLTALRMSEILKDDELIIMLVNAIARIHEKQKSYHTARNYYYKAYKIAKRTKNYRGQAALLVNLGVSNLAEKNYILAKKHLHKALSISEEMGNRLFIASILVNFGKIAYEEEDYQTGEQHLYQALSLFQELDNKESISFTPIPSPIMAKQAAVWQSEWN
ncbi:MAG: tetratricopeptide repeat protein [Anaerolineae bacterium]|nr:tetratricopeptide repeat protein [Anaerolineae bacterium]